MKKPALKLFRYPYIFIIIFAVFIAAYIFLSLQSMSSTPFMEYDGSNRAEAVRQMKAHHEFLAPLTGSPYLRNDALKLQILEFPQKFLYYHLERPPLVFDLMVASISLFGYAEVWFRMPSFLLGLSIFILLPFFIRKMDKKINATALITAFTAIVVSFDWWSSSQHALLDTAIAVFLFLSVASMLVFLENKKNLWIILSGVFLGFAILSKGQPAGMMAFPLMFLIITKEINIKQLLLFILSTSLIVSFWFIPAVSRFGFTQVVSTFIGFAGQRFATEDTTQKAPVYWYARWWFDTFRPGFSLFLVLLALDFLKRNFNKRQLLLLSYIIGSFVIYSVAKNKVWWYVLPIIPAVSLYIYHSLSHHLRGKTFSVFQLSLVIIFSSLPVFLYQRTVVALLYGIVVFAINLFVLTRKSFLLGKFNIFPYGILLTLMFFFFNFPQILPIYPETKNVSLYYKNLPGNKCLYVQDMPYESALYYSDAGEINYLQPETKLSEDCINYLMTTDVLKVSQPVYTKEDIRLYKIDDK